MTLCEPAEPQSTVTNRLNTLLYNGGPGYVLTLCQHENYYITAPLVFTAPNQQITTAGSPVNKARAMLTLDETNFGLTTAVVGTCTNCDGVKLSYLQVNGSRNDASRITGNANIEMGGPNRDQTIEYVHSFNPRAWSCLHVSEGALNCTGTMIQNNDIGPCGSDQDDQWADGISVACANSTIRNNLINSPTDGGIVLFGSPGTTVENNIVWIETVQCSITKHYQQLLKRTHLDQNTLLGGINLVDYDPWSGDYKGTVVRDNIIVGGQSNEAALKPGDKTAPNSGDAIIKIGIAVGSKVWFGRSPVEDNTLQGGSVIGNIFRGAFSFGIAAASIAQFTIMNNSLENTLFIGLKGADCLPEAIPKSQAFIAEMNSIVQSTLQQGFKNVTNIDLLTCFVAPGNGDYWPNGSVSRPTKTHYRLGVALGITLAIAILGMITYLVPRYFLKLQKA